MRLTYEEVKIVLSVFEQAAGDRYPDLLIKLRSAYEAMSDEYKMAVAE